MKRAAIILGCATLAYACCALLLLSATAAYVCTAATAMAAAERWG